MAKVKKKKIATCFFCKVTVPRATVTSPAVLCGNCTQRLSGSPASIGKGPKPKADPSLPKTPKVPKGTKVAVAKATGFGRGWHLKKHFVAPDGTVYSFGKAV